MRDHPYVAAVCILLLLAAVVLFLYLVFERLNRWFENRALAILQRWAKSNGYELVRHERVLGSGPYPWFTHCGQTMYHATIMDQHGRTRRGWVRCGRMLIGVLSGKAEVRWDEE